MGRILTVMAPRNKIFDLTMGAIDKLHQRAQLKGIQIGSAKEKERKEEQLSNRWNFERYVSNVLGDHIPETETRHVMNEEPIIKPGHQPEYTYTRKRVPVDKKEYQERALQRLRDYYGVTRLDKTPEGTPVFYVDDVKKFRDARAFHGSIAGDPGSNVKEQDYIVMPSSSFGISPERSISEQRLYQHERAHATEEHRGQNKDIRWEHRPEELEADKVALDVLKRNLERAGIEYTPAMGAEYLLRLDQPVRGEVVPNPSKVPFVDRFDYLPVSAPAKKQVVIDALGRPSIQSFTDPEEYWKVRKAEALKRFGTNPAMYRNIWGEEGGLQDLERYITRSKLATGVSQEDILMDTFQNEKSIF